ncbi:MAG: UbiD family decarboxylase [Planctomycetes bacterium]|nr:UbiD family decarboxylase [Planctomycetota bacterium]
MSASAPLPPADLREFLARLAAAGELVEIDAEVDPRLEVAEIHRRVIAAGGPALLFRRVKGSPFRLVTNLFGNARRVEIAFGRPRELVAELVRFAQELPPPTLAKFWRARGLLARLARVGMRRERRAPVAEVVEATDLEALPLTQSWARDGGCFATLPLVYTEALDAAGKPGGPGNLGIYRMQRYDARSTGMHWQIGKGGGFHHHAAEARGLDLPVTVFLGGPPAALAAALAPLPENVPELLLASLLLGRRLPQHRDPRAPHALLADAEVALVGRVPAGVRRPEGPFGDHYGYYSLQHDFPVFEVERVFRRRDAIVPATVVGKPRQEDFFLGDFLQELLSPLFPLAMPSVVDLWSYGETGYHALAAAVVRDRYKREAMVSAFRILGEGQLALTKFLLLTDAPIDLRDWKALLTHVLARARFETDLFVFPNLSMDTLDYAGAKLNQGSKGVLLGLGPPIRTLPAEFRGPLPAGARAAAPFSPGCLVVEGPQHAADRDFAARLARDPALAGWPLVVVSDDVARATASSANFLWMTFTRFDPARDLFAAAESIVERQLVRTPPLVIDARMKEHLPDELFCDAATRATVDRRWGEYFPDGMAAGDSDRGHLDPPRRGS